MSRDAGSGGVPDPQDRLKAALGGVVAPPGLAERIRADLDRVDREAKAAGGGGVERPFFLRRGWPVLAIAASFLVILLLPRASRWSTEAPGGGRVAVREAGAAPVMSRVRLEGLVVCYDCAREGADLEYQKTRCDWHDHTNGLRLADGRLYRFVLKDSLEQTLLARAMRGSRVRVEGDLYPSIAHLDVARFVTLARCHASPRGSSPAVL
jgi:hypothetical protein